MPQLQHHHPSHQLRELVERELARNAYVGSRDLRIEIDKADVVLKGIVRSYYQKQIAQESLRSISGIGQIHNELTVIFRY